MTDQNNGGPPLQLLSPWHLRKPDVRLQPHKLTLMRMVPVSTDPDELEDWKTEDVDPAFIPPAWWLLLMLVRYYGWRPGVPGQWRP